MGVLPSSPLRPDNSFLEGGNKRQLITDKPLSVQFANSPAPFSLPLSLPFFLPFTASVSFHSEDGVFVLQTGLEAVVPLENSEWITKLR